MPSAWRALPCYTLPRSVGQRLQNSKHSGVSPLAANHRSPTWRCCGRITVWRHHHALTWRRTLSATAANIVRRQPSVLYTDVVSGAVAMYNNNVPTLRYFLPPPLNTFAISAARSKVAVPRPLYAALLQQRLLILATVNGVMPAPSRPLYLLSPAISSALLRGTARLPYAP